MQKVKKCEMIVKKWKKESANTKNTETQKVITFYVKNWNDSEIVKKIKKYKK